MLSASSLFNAPLPASQPILPILHLPSPSPPRMSTGTVRHFIYPAAVYNSRTFKEGTEIPTALSGCRQDKVVPNNFLLYTMIGGCPFLDRLPFLPPDALRLMDELDDCSWSLDVGICNPSSLPRACAKCSFRHRPFQKIFGTGRLKVLWVHPRHVLPLRPTASSERISRGFRSPWNELDLKVCLADVGPDCGESLDPLASQGTPAPEFHAGRFGNLRYSSLPRFIRPQLVI